MNHQFANSRPSVNNNNPPPFYNPQKESASSTNPIIYQPQINSPNYINNPNSKSFITRSNIIEPPKTNNTSAYIKPVQQAPTTKFGTNTNGTTTNNFVNFGNKNTSTEMVKSSIHAESNLTKAPIETPTNNQTPQRNSTTMFNTNTPNRRAPRMSEPLFQPSSKSGVTFDPSLKTGNLFDKRDTIATNSNQSPVLPKKFKDHKQFESNFFKKHNTPNTAEKDELRFSQNNYSQKKQDIRMSQKEDIRFSQTKIEQKQEKKLGWLKSSQGKKKKVSLNDFQVIKQLGFGKYGKVNLVKQKYSGFICALKQIEKKLLKQEEITQQFIRQLKIQMFLNHPNIIKMYGFFDDAESIYIILQVGTGGQLFHQLKRTQPMNQLKAAGFMRQVCESVNYIHSLSIIHRDIKPQNIVLHENVVKLCDFGWSVYKNNKLRTTFCGTPLYVCPQILRGKEYDEKIDIWSLGIMMYEMLVGENPFKITKEEQLIKIVKDQIQIPSYVFVSREGREFLDKCLKKNPSDRGTIKQLLAHQFFISNPQKAQKKLM